MDYHNSKQNVFLTRLKHLYSSSQMCVLQVLWSSKSKAIVTLDRWEFYAVQQ